jgi:hypothetical protein
MTFKNSQDNNLIRDNIIKYFPERDCVTLTRPVEEEKDLQRLNEIPFGKLKTTFKMEFNQLKSKVYQETLPKRINGKKLTGPILANLIIEFVNTINSGDIPSIENSWDNVIKKDITDYYEKSLNRFKANLNKMDLAKENDIVKNIYTYKYEAFVAFLKLFNINQDSFKNQKYLKFYEDHKIKLVGEMNKLENGFLSSNKEKSCKICKETFSNLYSKNVIIIFKS